MEKIINPDTVQQEALLQRPASSLNDLTSLMVDVFQQVSMYKNKAIFDFVKKFDKAEINSLQVDDITINSSQDFISQDLKEAIDQAKENIEKFHLAQKTDKVTVETTPGVTCWQEKRPIQKVGLYIPGGTAPLFSTILMLAIPAKIAGCKDIILCTPSDKEGRINPAILYTAAQCGIAKIYRVGGAQAVAGMTLGTETIPKVDKIFGPGNAYVTAAKQYAINFGVAIDMPAGPSELLVLADSTANAQFVASDLLSQAEHGVDSQVILVSTSTEFIDNVIEEIDLQVSKLPRQQIAQEALKNAKFICFKEVKMAMSWINQYAPEHFIVCTKQNEEIVESIENAGSVFLGNYTPESAGDYASGTNHTLPTSGFAKSYSGVNLDAFMKAITFQRISKTGIQNIGKTIEIMAEAEGLFAHKNAVTLRLNALKNK